MGLGQARVLDSVQSHFSLHGVFSNLSSVVESLDVVVSRCPSDCERIRKTLECVEDFQLQLLQRCVQYN